MIIVECLFSSLFIDFHSMFRSGHMLTHAEEKPHKCRVPNCNRNYCDARSLKRHIENTHQEILAEIYEHAQDQYKSYLPESAVVKVKDATTNNDVSTDSIDGTSPRSFPDATRTTTLYTYVTSSFHFMSVLRPLFSSGTMKKNVSHVKSVGKHFEVVLH